MPASQARVRRPWRSSEAAGSRCLDHTQQGRAGRSSAQPKLTQKALNGIGVPTPTFDEQERIASKLDALFERSRRAKAALDAVPPLLDKLRQSILTAAFRGDLTRDWRAKNPDVEPASKLLERIRIERRRRWEEAELEKIRAKGKEPKDDKWKSKYLEPEPVDMSNERRSLPNTWAWASVADLTQCLDAQRVPVSRKDREGKGGMYPYYGANGQIDSVDDFLFNEPLVLVTEDETFYGRTKPIAYQVDGKCWVNNHAHVLRAISPIAPAFVCFSLMHYPVEPWLTGTTGRAKLTQGAMNRLPLALPPLEELSIVTQRVQEALSASEQSTLRLGDHGARLHELGGAILRRAFEGQLL